MVAGPSKPEVQYMGERSDEPLTRKGMKEENDERRIGLKTTVVESTELAATTAMG